jgi:hypothetical protein
MESRLTEAVKTYLDTGDELERDVYDLQGRFDDWLMNPNLDGESMDLEAKLMCDLMKAARSLATNQRTLADTYGRDRILRHLRILKDGERSPRPKDEVDVGLSLGD